MYTLGCWPFNVNWLVKSKILKKQANKNIFDQDALTGCDNSNFSSHDDQSLFQFSYLQNQHLSILKAASLYSNKFSVLQIHVLNPESEVISHANCFKLANSDECLPLISNKS
ncbi:hypothetical protein ACTXT7_003494 [Hymenolepis weldensis]